MEHGFIQLEILKMAKKVVKKIVDLAAQSVTFDFGDGTKEVFLLASCPEETRIQLALHGGSQKIGDSYAGAKEAGDVLAYAKQSTRDTIAQLYAGDWAVRGTGEGIRRASDLATALARISEAQGKPKSVEAWTEYLDKATDEQKAALKSTKAVAAEIAKIVAERAAEKAKKLAEAAAAAQEAKGPEGATEETEMALPDIPEVVVAEEAQA